MLLASVNCVELWRSVHPVKHKSIKKYVVVDTLQDKGRGYWTLRGAKKRFKKLTGQDILDDKFINHKK